MIRQTIYTLLIGSILAFFAGSLLKPGTRRDYMRMGLYWFRKLRRNWVINRIFTGTMAKQMIRRLQLAK
jgi:hypothetical protein